jgi:antitoxin (DNA-binding transcriptional repressor) of toxin-antitoxin stability system
VSEVLRRAERGERLTITVDGRPVAELGPLARPPRLPSLARLGELLADTPVDPEWAGDLERLRGEDRAAAHDPWAS